jgi:peptidoglycan/xylan/chitin deacetylase (PgdA/CDA1 family)
VKATLTYHSLDDSGSAISIPPAVFDRHLAWLTSGRVRVLTLDRIAEAPDSAGDAVAVTFDDGFLNTREAIERLLSHGIPASVFVVSGRVGGDNDWNGKAQRGIPRLPLMTWTDLEQLVSKGLAVEAHSRNHHALTGLSTTELDDELGGCQEELHARLGTRSSHLAYPYGERDETVETRARAFFRYGHTAEFRCLSSSDAALRLPRLDLYYFQTKGMLEAWGTPAFDRRVAWCAARRKIRGYLLQGGTM